MHEMLEVTLMCKKYKGFAAWLSGPDVVMRPFEGLIVNTPSAPSVMA